MWRGWWLAIAALLAPIATVDGGSALHISDFHQDNDYSPMNGDISFYCHNSTHGTRLGDYGDYMCDAPKSLVMNALNAASRINPTPKYIFWTGDNVPHINNTLYNSSDVVRNIQQTTAQLNATFPNVSKIFPVLGNHDYWPSNGFPDQQNPVYKGAFDQWKHWIGDQAESTFLKGGYYKYSLDSKTTLLALNTNLYYNEDGYFPNFTNPADPADQFAFMEQELSNATKNGQFVHIVAHIAPGVFDRTANFTWLRPDYNKRFIDIAVRYSNVIKWMLFGHHHTDTFHIVKDANSAAVQTMLLAPAVTPWFSTLPGAGANNPAIRFITFNDSNWDMLDITTYYVDLTELNHNASTQWKKEYSFSDSTGYNISLINAQSMAALLQRMKDNDTLFQLYIKYNSVMYDVQQVEGPRKIAQLCSIEFIDLDQYYQCLKEGGVTPSPAPSSTPSSSPSAASPLASQFSAYVSIILSAAIVLVLFS